MLKNIKCVIFDLDGVITETSNQHFEAWQDMASSIGIDLDASFEDKLKGVSRKESLERILEYAHVTLPETQKIRLQEQKNDHYVSLISSFDASNVFAGVTELLDYLKLKNIRVALGSASKNGPSLIQALGIADRFDYIVDPNLCQSKPAPDIFLDAMKHFNFQPNECLGIEDAVAGVKAIKSARMFAVGVGDPRILSEADVVFQNTFSAAQWMMSNL